MFKPDRIARQIAKSGPLNALDRATRKSAPKAIARSRPLDLIQKQAAEFSTSTSKFKDNTGKNGGNDTLLEIVTNKKPTGELGKPPGLPDKSLTNPIREAAAKAFKEPNETAINGITSLAENFPAIRAALLKNNKELPTISSEERKEILDRHNIDEPNNPELKIQTRKGPETKIYDCVTADGTVLKVHSWLDIHPDDPHGVNIYSEDQREEALKGMFGKDWKKKITLGKPPKDCYHKNCFYHALIDDTGRTGGWLGGDNPRDIQKLLNTNFERVTGDTYVPSTREHSTEIAFSKIQQGDKMIFRRKYDVTRFSMENMKNWQKDWQKKNPGKFPDASTINEWTHNVIEEGQDILHAAIVRKVEGDKILIDEVPGLSIGQIEHDFRDIVPDFRKSEIEIYREIIPLKLQEDTEPRTSPVPTKWAKQSETGS